MVATELVGVCSEFAGVVAVDDDALAASDCDPTGVWTFGAPDKSMAGASE